MIGMLCNDKCGSFLVPFPFHLNASCAYVSTVFNLSCLNSTTLYLHIGIESYRLLGFFSDGVLVDFPGRSYTCRNYNGLNSFDFEGNEYFGISDDNVVGLYDCEDSSLCKADCETNELPDCDGNTSGPLACCYPLFDHSNWHSGDRFWSFSKFGCRGFSSWEGQEAYGKECECDNPKHSQRKLVIVAGVLAPVCILASLLLFLCILK